jgi:hypothetical protein
VTVDSNDTNCVIENVETEKCLNATNSDNEPCEGDQSLYVFHTDDNDISEILQEFYDVVPDEIV